MRRLLLLLVSCLTTAATLAIVIVQPHVFGAHRARASCTAAAGSSPLVTLKAPNGLYYVPGLRAAREPSLRDSAYGLAALRALGRPTVLSAAPARVRALMDDAIVPSAIWSRWYLLQVQEATGTPLLGAQDAREMLALLSPQGYFSDPSLSAGAGHESELLAATSAALDVIAAADRTALTGLSATAAWLQRLGAADSTHPFVAALRQTALAHVGGALDVEADLAQAQAWLKGLRAGGEADFASVTYDLYGYVSLLHLAAGVAEPGTAAFFAPVLAQAVDAPDLQNAFFAAAAWRGLGGDGTPATALADRLASYVAPDGLVREHVTYVGTVDATEAVVELLGLSGRNTCDPQLLAALTQLRTTQWAEWDAVTRARWVIAAKASGHPDVEDSRREALRGLLAALPAAVDATGAQGQWTVPADLVAQLGGRAPAPRLDEWDTSTRLGAQAAAATVTTMTRLGLSADIPSWLRDVDLLALAGSATAAPTTLEYVNLLNAHLSLGRPLDPQTLTAARAGMLRSAGCEGLPGLMRASASDSVCDLRTSLATARLKILAPSLSS